MRLTRPQAVTHSVDSLNILWLVAGRLYFCAQGLDVAAYSTVVAHKSCSLYPVP